MYNNNNVNISPKIVKSAIWGIAGIVILIVAMAFIRPWYNFKEIVDRDKQDLIPMVDVETSDKH